LDGLLPPDALRLGAILVAKPSEPYPGPYIRRVHFGAGGYLGRGSGMRRAPIRMGITLLVATLVGSLAVPSMASVQSQGNMASRLAVTSVERVKIINFAFKPKAITIAKGTKVRWTNAGTVSHTTTSNKGLWDSGVLAPGAAFGRVFRKVGTFKYHCTIHPTLMHGKIIVS
jgi:plastocyanin